MSNLVEPISIYPLNVAQEKHTPQRSSQADYCNINYPHLLILRGFSSAPELNFHSQTVTCSSSKETDQPLLTEFSFQKVDYTAIVYARSTKARLFLQQLVLLCVYMRDEVTTSLTLGWEHQLYPYGEDKVLVLETVLVKAQISIEISVEKPSF